VNLLPSILEIVPVQLLSLGLATLISIVGYFLKPRVKIIWGQKTNFSHILRPKKEGDTAVRVSTAHYIIQNAGRAPAKDVEIVLNYAPDEVSVWPQRLYELKLNNEQRQILKLEFLAPKEYVEILLLNIRNDLPDVLSVKSPDCVGKAVNIGYHHIYPKWVYSLMLFGMFLGGVFVIEKILRIWV
jgi:hypothetical protein